MKREHMIEILSEILGGGTEEWENGCVDISIEDPIDDEKRFAYQYRLLEDGKIQVKQHNEKKTAVKSLRDIVWRNCGLETVCKKYRRQYNDWQSENNNVPYVEVQIDDEKNGKPQGSLAMMRNLWALLDNGRGGHEKNLCLLLGEAGTGKSSFCYGMRRLASEEIKDVFKKESAAFPFFFDLNEFRSGDFDKFIETELLEKYKLALKYRIFVRLCQEGIFMVVLDAWDQMRSAGNMPRTQIERDIHQMDALWKKQGRALITCRQSFYQRQLKRKEISGETAGLYKLNGFGQDAAIGYICKFTGIHEKEKVTAWIEQSWQMNADLLEKPLNIRLLAKHFYNITGLIDFTKYKVDTYSLLKISYNEWKEQYDVKDEWFVKKLVLLALDSGLNCNVLLKQFRKGWEEEEWDAVRTKIKCLDFINYDEKEQKLEFHLAAFQEFLWAYFVLKELETDPKELNPSESLIRKYLLSKEVREWICRILAKRGDETGCLQKQLSYVKYRRKEQAGYCGSNALTLLCDLNTVHAYKKQFEEIKSSLRRTPLMGVDLRSKDLSGADFYGAELEGADFSYANLTGVNFTGADLTNTTWQEHSWMNKCVFAMHKDALCVAAGTATGGLLMYWVDDGRQELISLREDAIRDLIFDNEKIYTVSSDGMASCIIGKGQVQDVLIAQRELRSIACSKFENCFYISADDHSIYRYNWKTHSQQQIKYDVGSGSEVGRISGIHYYYSHRNEEYLAFTMHKGHALVLLNLTGKDKGTVTAVCRLENYEFGEICFADEWMVYSVIGKGVFAISVQEVLADIPENEMLDTKQLLLGVPEADAFFFSWADKKLYVAAKGKGDKINKIDAIELDTKEHKTFDLDWFYNNQVYRFEPDQLEGFCMSEDGQYAAFSGGSLTVLQNLGTFYGLAGEPVKARLSCKGVNISGCTGLDRRCKKFLTDRGAFESK